MALPASGQISFNDVRVEMTQSAMTNYAFQFWATGYGTYNGTDPQYSPINVHGTNSGRYSTSNFNYQLSSWYSYDNSLSYACDGTFRDLFYSYSFSNLVCQSSMIIFDAGVSNQTYRITISGGTTDFTGVRQIVVYYGKPWTNDGIGIGSPSVVYTNNIEGAALNISFDYNYVYNSISGQYLYIVIYSCVPT